MHVSKATPLNLDHAIDAPSEGEDNSVSNSADVTLIESLVSKHAAEIHLAQRSLLGCMGGAVRKTKDDIDAGRSLFKNQACIPFLHSPRPLSQIIYYSGLPPILIVLQHLLQPDFAIRDGKCR